MDIDPPSFDSGESGGSIGEPGSERGPAFLLLDLLVDAGLFQHGVGAMARFHAVVQRHVDSCDWAVPDLVVAFSLPME